MTERGWTASETELFRGRVLDLLFVASEDGMEADYRGFADEAGVTVGEVDGALDSLAASGLVTRGAAHGGGASAGEVELTRAGAREAGQRRERRADLGARAVAARDAVLHWMYSQKRAGTHLPIVTRVLGASEGWFEGEPFTEQEIDHASENLHARGLLKSAGSSRGPVLRGEITPQGEEVVEDHDSSLSAAAASKRGGQQIVTNELQRPRFGSGGHRSGHPDPRTSASIPTRSSRC